MSFTLPCASLTTARTETAPGRMPSISINASCDPNDRPPLAPILRASCLRLMAASSSVTNRCSLCCPLVATKQTLVLASRVRQLATLTGYHPTLLKSLFKRVHQKSAASNIPIVAPYLAAYDQPEGRSPPQERCRGRRSSGGGGGMAKRIDT
jgi:hypothetical protein